MAILSALTITLQAMHKRCDTPHLPPATTPQELAPRYAIELASLPLTEEHAAQRAKGCVILRHLVWGRPETSADMSGREALLERARCLLTAEEQVGAGGRECWWQWQGAGRDAGCGVRGAAAMHLSFCSGAASRW